MNRITGFFDVLNFDGELRYEVFGRQTDSANSSEPPVGFDPSKNDFANFDAADLQYNHHRHYDPTPGRWISEDPPRAIIKTE